MTHDPFRINCFRWEFFGQVELDLQNQDSRSEAVNCFPVKMGLGNGQIEAGTKPNEAKSAKWPKIRKYLDRGDLMTKGLISEHNLEVLDRLIQSSELYVVNETRRYWLGVRKRAYIAYTDTLIGKFLQVDWNRLALQEIRNKFVLLEKRFFCILNRIKSNLRICMFCGAVLTSHTVNSMCFENLGQGPDSVIIKELFEEYVSAIMNQDNLRDKVAADCRSKRASRDTSLKENSL